jgi:hypothetical protein
MQRLSSVDRARRWLEIRTGFGGWGVRVEVSKGGEEDEDEEGSGVEVSKGGGGGSQKVWPSFVGVEGGR